MSEYDLTPTYKALQARLQSRKIEQNLPEDFSVEPTIESVPQAEDAEVASFADKVVDAPQQFIMGGIEGALEIAEKLGQAGNFVREELGERFGIIDTIGELTQPIRDFEQGAIDTVRTNLKQEENLPRSIVGQFARTGGQFSAGIPAAKAVGAGFKYLAKTLGVAEKLAIKSLSSTAVKSAAIGVGADVAAFDPFEERVSNLIADVSDNPDAGAVQQAVNTVAEWLKADGDDSRLEATAKQALEGAGVGFLFDTALKGLRVASKAVLKSKPQTAAGKQVASEYMMELAHNKMLKKTIDDIPGSVAVADEATRKAAMRAVTSGGTVSRALQNSEKRIAALRTKLKGMYDEEALAGLESSLVERANKLKPYKLEKDAEQQLLKSLNDDPVANNKAYVDLNLNRIDTGEDVANLIGSTAKAIKSNNIPPRTLKETEQFAKEYGVNLDDLRGKVDNIDVELTAARQVMGNIGREILDMNKQFRDGTLDANGTQQLIKRLNMYANVQDTVKSATRGLGRGLGALRIKTGFELNSTPVNWTEIRKDDISLKRLRTISDMIDLAGDDPKALRNALRPSLLTRIMRGTEELVVNSFLSGFGTQALNLGSSAANATYMASRRMLAGALSLDGKELRSSAAGFAAMLDQTLASLNLANSKIITPGGDNLQGAAVRSFKYHNNVLDPFQTVIDRPQFAITANEFDIQNKYLAMLTNAVGSYGIRWPSRLLGAGDEMVKNGAYAFEVSRQAYMRGIDAGLEGKELSAFVNRIKQDIPDDVHELAMQNAQTSTFTQPLNPGITGGASIQRAVNETPGAKLVLPFIRTPWNIAKYTFEHMPATNLMVKASRDRVTKAMEMKRNPDAFTATEQANIMADFKDEIVKVTLGSAVMMWASEQAFSGKITGGYDPLKGHRDVQKDGNFQPYSIVLENGQQVSYQRAEPLGTLLALGANYNTIRDHITDEQAESMTLVMSSLIGQSILDKQYFSTIADLIGGITFEDAQSMDKLEQLASGIAVGVTPNSALLRGIRRVQDPIIREVDGVMDSIVNTIPGLSTTLPPRLDGFGEPQYYPPGIAQNLVNPFVSRKRKDNKILTELNKYKIPMPHVPGRIDGVELTSQQHNEWIGMMTKRVVRDGKTYSQALEAAIDSDAYQKALPIGDPEVSGSKGEVLADIRREYLRESKKEFLKEHPEVKERVMKRNTQRAFTLIQ